MNTLWNCLVVSVAACVAAWSTTATAADDGYETAAYEVLEKDGSIEIRRYPSLKLVTTPMKSRSTGRNGSFMRLFQYISGGNQQQEKVAMTTPVFMSEESKEGQMGFVLPKQVAEAGPPEPSDPNVKVTTRAGGTFAVIRFPGRVDQALAKQKESELREWMEAKGYHGHDGGELAGYDPPFTPAAKRRNEVLIRLKPAENE